MKNLKINFINKLVIFCVALLVIRHYKTEHYSFLFLFWNLFLAWLPIFLIRRVKESDLIYRKLALCVLTLLFLPNSPYILTDLFHLKKELIAPLWFDLIMILSFAFLGMIYFISASEILLVHINSLMPRFRRINKALLFLATGYGIYLGRYLRFNSWDIVSDPLTLVQGIYTSLFDPFHFKETFAVTITFTVFLYLVYEIYLSFKTKLLLDQK